MVTIPSRVCTRCGASVESLAINPQTRRPNSLKYCLVFRSRLPKERHLDPKGEIECTRWRPERRPLGSDWQLVDEKNLVWVSPVLRKYVGRSNPEEYRAYYCPQCRMEIIESDIRQKYVYWRSGTCLNCQCFDAEKANCPYHGELRLRNDTEIAPFTTCDHFVGQASKFRMLGHIYKTKWHRVKMTVKRPACEVYACPICGMPADPALQGYCCNLHRQMMLKRLRIAALSVDESIEEMSET